jgi:hypothetical protein
MIVVQSKVGLVETVLNIDNSVIGIHKGTENKTINFGIFLRYIINDIYEKIEKESDDKKEL